MITQQNISAYLRYLNPYLKKPFDDALIERWNGLNDAQIKAVLNDFYVKTQWNDTQVQQMERGFFAPNVTKEISEVISIPPQATQTIQATVNEVYEDAVVVTPIIPAIETPMAAPIEIPVASTLVTQQPVTPPPSMPPPVSPAPVINTKPTIESNINDYAPKQKKSRLPIVFFLMLLGVGGYIAYQYMHFQQMGYAYTLTNNVSVRDSPLENGNAIYRMDLFGSSLKKSGGIENTLSEVKVIQTVDENNYLSVQATPSFKDFLLNNKDNTFYVHNNVVTTDKSEYEQYRKIFNNLSADYNELDKLQLKYRKIIVSAIERYQELNGLVVAKPCNIEKKLSSKAPLSIGQYKSKDEFGNIKNLFAIVQLSNEQYYTIVANEMGQVQNIYTTQLSNFGVSEPLKLKGKFRYYDPYNFTYGDFIWEGCDKQYKAISSLEPFSNFNVQY